MKRTWYKIRFGLIKKIFIGLLTSLVDGSNRTKCVSLSNQKCMTQPTLAKVTCRVQIWKKKKHFVKIVTILVAVLLKMTFCLCIFFVFTKNLLF